MKIDSAPWRFQETQVFLMDVEKNALIHAALDKAPQGVIITSGVDNKVVFINPVMAELMGVEQEILLGRTLTEGFFNAGGKMFYPEKAPYNTSLLKGPDQCGPDNQWVARDIFVIIKPPGGSRVWALMSTSCVYDEQRKTKALISIVHDITRRKHEIERLDYAMTASVDGLWDWDTGREEGYLSPRYYEMLGYRLGEFPPTLKAWQEMLHPDDREQALAKFNGIVNGTSETYNSEYRLRTRNGSYRWFRSRGMRVDEGQGQASVRIVGTHLDITREREMEEELYNSRENLQAELTAQTLDLQNTNRKLESILDSSSESIWVIDGDGTVARINRKSETLLNIRAEEVVGKHYKELVSSGIVDLSVTRKAFQTRRTVTMMQKALRTGRSLLVTSTPVFDDEGNISMVIVNERDLTQLNRLQQELEQVRGETDRIREAMTALNLKELRDQEIIAKSKEMQEVLVAALKLSRINVSTILILGESGTGKGLLAKFIHMKSLNKKGPFVQINCAALPETLLEAELFGYEKGAFTGARDQGKIGLFEMAQGGTLFLDELGELSQSVQAKLLKCLEDKEVFHLGGLKPIKINCTVIAATNVDLVDQVNHKRFRQDLYFRLNTFTLTLPPLRRRPEDILELTMFFLDKYNKAYGMERRISSQGLERLQAYPFPGNVRELENAIKKSVVMSETNLMETVLDSGTTAMNPRGVAMASHTSPGEGKQNFERMVMDFEKDILTRTISHCTTTRAIASHLGMTQSQVMRKLKKHGLSTMLKAKKRMK